MTTAVLLCTRPGDLPGRLADVPTCRQSSRARGALESPDRALGLGPELGLGESPAGVEGHELGSESSAWLLVDGGSAP